MMKKFNLPALFLTLLLCFAGCKQTNDVTPTSKTTNQNASARKAASSLPLGPITQAQTPCPTGYVWDDVFQRCVAVPTADINPNSIVYNTAQAHFITVDATTKYYYTPGTLAGKIIGKSQIYVNGVATNQIMLFRLKSASSTVNQTEVFMPTGKYLALIKTLNTSSGVQVTSIGVTPNYNPANTAFYGCWSSCVVNMANQIQQNAILLIACALYNVECIGGILVSCTAHCLTH